MANYKVRGFEKISKEMWINNTGYTMNIPHSIPSVIDSLKVYENIKMPKRGTSKSAGYDIFSPISFSLSAGQEIVIPTGIKVFMMANEYLAIHPRSGIGFTYYTRLANTTGIIDSDYYNNPKNEGHIWIKIRNESDYEGVLNVEAGKGIAQGILSKYLLTDDDSNLEESNRNGGFGSTG